MLLRLHLLTLPKVFLLCLPKRASTAICPRLIQCCSTPVPAPFSYICCCVDRCRCHGLGRWQQRPKGPGEGTSAGVGVTARAMSSQRCDLATWLSVSCADSALAHQTLQLAAVYFKYHTNRESKWRIFLSIHKLLHSPSNQCHAIFIDFCHNNSRAD